MVRSTPIMPLEEPLTDGVVLVRTRRSSDLDAMAAASHDPETLRWLDDGPLDAEARRTSMSRVDDAWRSGRATPLVIAESVTSHAVGIINLQFRGDDIASVAYSVFPACRGRSFASRAVALVAGWAFRDLGVRQLFLEVDAANAASIRVAEKCQFHRVDTTPDGSSSARRRTKLVFCRLAA